MSLTSSPQFKLLNILTKFIQQREGSSFCHFHRLPLLMCTHRQFLIPVEYLQNDRTSILEQPHYHTPLINTVIV